MAYVIDRAIASERVSDVSLLGQRSALDELWYNKESQTEPVFDRTVMS